MESSKEGDARGALIVLEGLDRCGKTSQCSKLLSFLEESGHAVESWRFPDRNTGVGQMISSYLTNESHLDDHAIHLLFSANRWEKRLTLLVCACPDLYILTSFEHSVLICVDNNQLAVCLYKFQNLLFSCYGKHNIVSLFSIQLHQ